MGAENIVGKGIDYKVELSSDSVNNLRNGIAELTKVLVESIEFCTNLELDPDENIKILISACNYASVGLAKCLIELPESDTNISVTSFKGTKGLFHDIKTYIGYVTHTIANISDNHTLPKEIERLNDAAVNTLIIFEDNRGGVKNNVASSAEVS
jgi:hypothetical protein